MTYWWEDAPCRETVRLMHAEGESTRSLQGWIRANGYQNGTSLSRLRARFSELGWGAASQQPPSDPYVDIPEIPPLDPIQTAISRTRTRLENTQDKRELKALLEANARWQQLLDTVVAAVPPLPQPSLPLPIPPRGGPARPTPHCALFLFGDIHAGLETRDAEVKGRLAFSTEDLDARLDAWRAGVLATCADADNLGGLAHIGFLCLGDWIENQMMRPGAQKNVGLLNVDSVIYIATTFARCVWAVRARYPQVPISIDLLGGNHDRIGEKGVYAFDESYHVIVGALLTAFFAGYDGVHLAVHRSPFAALDFGGHSFLLHHGHGLSGTVPQAALEARVSRWEGLHRRGFQYVAIGHYHHPLQFVSNLGWEVIVNGALADASTYSGNDLGLLNPGTQTALLVTQADGVRYRRLLRVARDPEPTQVEERWAGTPSIAVEQESRGSRWAA